MKSGPLETIVLVAFDTGTRTLPAPSSGANESRKRYVSVTAAAGREREAQSRTIARTVKACRMCQGPPEPPRPPSTARTGGHRPPSDRPSIEDRDNESFRPPPLAPWSTADLQPQSRRHQEARRPRPRVTTRAFGRHRLAALTPYNAI